jgi:hypothetical protein
MPYLEINVWQGMETKMVSFGNGIGPDINGTV